MQPITAPLTWLDLAGISLRPRFIRDEQQQRRQHEDHRDSNDAPQGHLLGPGADRAPRSPVL